MSEYQRYEFMTVDRPLTASELEPVEDLSSHIEATSTHALIEYNWGDFKYDPIKVLQVRLAHNEPGLSLLLVRELRELGQGKTTVSPSTGERVTYATLLAESKGVKDQLEREKREQERKARLRHLQEIHDHQEDYWRQIDQALIRTSGASYDEAVRILLELREAADQFGETREFRERFRTWVPSHLRRPAFIKRLESHKFSLPEV